MAGRAGGADVYRFAKRLTLMLERGRFRGDGVQLPMLDDADSVKSAWLAERILSAERLAFEERLTNSHGLREVSAGVLSRHLAAMVRQSNTGTVASLVSSPALVVAAIKACATEGTRRARHLAVCDFIELFSDELPKGAAAGTWTALDSFPGRATPTPQFVDRSLGGSKKQVRARAPLSWQDGRRLISAAACNGERAGIDGRDAALVAMHVRSGLAPALVRTLQWEPVLGLLREPNEVGYVTVTTARGERALAVHESAAELLRALHRAEGEPPSGAVFVTARRPRMAVSSSLVAAVVANAAKEAGFPPLDLRHLRAPLGLWLLGQGWHEIRVRDAFGYERVRDLRDLLRPLKETNAQIRTCEFLVLGSGLTIVDCVETTGQPMSGHRIQPLIAAPN